jgi:hypothetical protein
MKHDKQERGGRRAVALITSVALISGCSSASSVTEPYETTGTISAMSRPPPKMPSTPKVECPGLDIRPGASTLNIAVKTDGATGSDLRYQLSFGQTACECRVQDGRMSIKVGVQGRILLGPLGTPGSVDIPLRYAVVKEGPEPRLIVTKFKRIAATISPGQTHIQFVDIEDGLNFPLPSSAELAAYVVYVGFDEVGDKNEKKPPKSPKPPNMRTTHHQ